MKNVEAVRERSDASLGSTEQVRKARGKWTDDILNGIKHTINTYVIFLLFFA